MWSRELEKYTQDEFFFLNLWDYSAYVKHEEANIPLNFAKTEFGTIDYYFQI